MAARGRPLSKVQALVKVESGANAGHALQRNWLLFFRFPRERKKNDLDRYKKKQNMVDMAPFSV